MVIINARFFLIEGIPKIEFDISVVALAIILTAAISNAAALLVHISFVGSIDIPFQKYYF